MSYLLLPYETLALNKQLVGERNSYTELVANVIESLSATYKNLTNKVKNLTTVETFTEKLTEYIYKGYIFLNPTVISNYLSVNSLTHYTTNTPPSLGKAITMASVAGMYNSPITFNCVSSIGNLTTYKCFKLCNEAYASYGNKTLPSVLVNIFNPELEQWLELDSDLTIAIPNSFIHKVLRNSDEVALSWWYLIVGKLMHKPNISLYFYENIKGFTNTTYGVCDSVLNYVHTNKVLPDTTNSYLAVTVNLTKCNEFDITQVIKIAYLTLISLYQWKYLKWSKLGKNAYDIYLQALRYNMHLVVNLTNLNTDEETFKFIISKLNYYKDKSKEFLKLLNRDANYKNIAYTFTRDNIVNLAYPEEVSKDVLDSTHFKALSAITSNPITRYFKIEENYNTEMLSKAILDVWGNNAVILKLTP